MRIRYMGRFDQFRQFKELVSKVSIDFPRLANRGLKLLWERTGDFSDALDIAKKRLTAIFFETTDFCNARCVMCGAKFMKRTRQVMPMDVYQTAVEQFAQAKGHSLMLSGFGEPLLDPHIVERVAMAKRFSTIRMIGFSTNGSLLTGEKYRALADAGLTNLNISIDGFNKQTYEKIRAGLSFEILGKNISEILKAHQAMGRPIQISVTSFTWENKEDLTNSPLYNDLINADIKPGLKWRVDNWGGLISGLSGDIHLMMTRRYHGPCALLYHSQVLVLPDGRVTPCHCRDLEGSLCIGDIKEATLSDIWCGSKLEELRAEQAAGQFRRPCDRCSASMPLRSWFTRSMVRWLVYYNETVPINEKIGTAVAEASQMISGSDDCVASKM